MLVVDIDRFELTVNEVGLSTDTIYSLIVLLMTMFPPTIVLSKPVPVPVTVLLICWTVPALYEFICWDIKNIWIYFQTKHKLNNKQKTSALSGPILFEQLLYESSNVRYLELLSRVINDFVKAEIELASILAILFEVVVRSREYILVIFKELSISCDFVDFLVEVNLVISIGVAAVNVWASVFRIVLKDDTVELLVVIEDASVVKIDLFVEVDAVVKAGVKIVVLIVDVVLVEVEFFVKVEVKKVVEGLIEDTGVWVVEILITFELIVIIDIEGGGAVSVDV